MHNITLEQKQGKIYCKAIARLEEQLQVDRATFWLS